jgi:hypothetical protein
MFSRAEQVDRARPIRLAGAAFMLGLTAASPAASQSLITLMGPLDGPRCWGRTYDAAHLAANPAQKVRSIRLDSVPRRNTLRNAPMHRSSEAFTFTDAKYTDVNIVMRNGRRVGQELSCSWDADVRRVHCGGESDSGSIVIRFEAGGRIHLAFPEGMRFGDDGDAHELTRRADRHYILLPLAPAQCRKSEV